MPAAEEHAAANGCSHGNGASTVGEDTICSLCGASVWDGSSDMKVFSFATNTII